MADVGLLIGWWFFRQQRTQFPTNKDFNLTNLPSSTVEKPPSDTLPSSYLKSSSPTTGSISYIIKEKQKKPSPKKIRPKKLPQASTDRAKLPPYPQPKLSEISSALEKFGITTK